MADFAVRVRGLNIPLCEAIVNNTIPPLHVSNAFRFRDRTLEGMLERVSHRVPGGVHRSSRPKNDRTDRWSVVVRVTQARIVDR